MCPCQDTQWGGLGGGEGGGVGGGGLMASGLISVLWPRGFATSLFGLVLESAGIYRTLVVKIGVYVSRLHSGN